MNQLNNHLEGYLSGQRLESAKTPDAIRVFAPFMATVQTQQRH